RLRPALPLYVAECAHLHHGRRAGRLRVGNGSRKVFFTGRRRSLQNPYSRAVRAPGPSLLRERAPLGRRRGRSRRLAPPARTRALRRAQRTDRRHAVRCLPHVAMLEVTKKDGVARVTLNRPELRNAFDDVLISSLTKTFAEIGKDPAVRVMILAGNGPAFCAGADLNWMKRMAGYSYEQNLADAKGLAEMLATLDRLPKPTIARVHGPVFAGGTGLVAACDIAVGTPEAKMCLSEAKLGLSPATISPYV